ncbi:MULTISPECIES: sulfurtransferase complex subunit TusC [Pseudomonas]|jgi:tRNA 2-thiouridine synthesizing protein C|uniref:Sulfurtransferase complex subunit TusC n=1 Tax=Pseudomonas grimontii TaxID=129847 RepID=A0A1H1GAR3_9PSED|nr:sulfurtransferase complex subunit TusC [Pseudomonas grimontii]MCS3512824.1 tRNA 2-thiouridine synthesizing protein C [Pseudomonas grimontii]TWR67768.1 sulfurtransferase complex subunit TusC [Pseudomonas grimontii]SDR09936.1 tRNA 2-thiouridine synthesizing protein C [Pseudomonas grimontii]
MSKSLLVISRQAPWAGPSAREALDIVLAGGAFDLPIGVLFMDDGVFQLAPHQDAKAVQQKDLGANLQALGLFGIDDVFACSHSLGERGLTQPANAQSLDSEAISRLIDRYDQVITL